MKKKKIPSTPGSAPCNEKEEGCQESEQRNCFKVGTIKSKRRKADKKKNHDSGSITGPK